MLKYLSRWLKPEIRVVSGQSLREGPAIVEGIGLAPAEPLRSPATQTPCLAYGYTVYSIVRTRGGAVPQAVRKRRAQTAFSLKLSDGAVVHADPAEVGEPLTHAEHKQLVEDGGEAVHVDEQIVAVGRKVRLEGMLTRNGDTWHLKYRLLENVGPGPAAPPPPPAPRPQKAPRRR